MVIHTIFDSTQVCFSEYARKNYVFFYVALLKRSLLSKQSQKYAFWMAYKILGLGKFLSEAVFLQVNILDKDIKRTKSGFWGNNVSGGTRSWETQKTCPFYYFLSENRTAEYHPDPKSFPKHIEGHL